MDKVARLQAAQRNELFSEAATRRGTTPAVVEKDFWVTWTLHRLFADTGLARLLMFKGGTSLSKAYGLIERFSEDIDLILEWRVLAGDDDPRAVRSKTRQGALNKQINAQAQGYIAESLLPQVKTALDGICQCAVSANDPYVIDVLYPAAFSDAYLRPEIRLEIGPLAAWQPHEERTVGCYAADAFPHVFAQAHCRVRVIRAERTFWEKATILHQEAHRPAGKPLATRQAAQEWQMRRRAWGCGEVS